MKVSVRSRYALVNCAAAAILAGCGGNASNGVVPINAAPDHLPNHKSFYYTGRAQDFKVPCFFGYYGEPGGNGAFGTGGSGGIGSSKRSSSYYAAGAGGGGGGGAGCTSNSGSYSGGGGGGGGGSSYIESSATNVHMWQGWKNPTHNGLIVLSW